jgi:hypothetical protein
VQNLNVLTRLFRISARLGGLLSVAGICLVVWYVEWGVHGCDDRAAVDGCRDRMDRDFAMSVLGWALVFAGLAVVGVAAVRARRARRR